MFLHSLLTGLRSDSIKLELKPCLQNTHVTDEKLFEKIKGAVSNEMERQQKRGSLNGLATSTNPVPLVPRVSSTKEAPTGGGGGLKPSTEDNKTQPFYRSTGHESRACCHWGVHREPTSHHHPRSIQVHNK